MAFHSTVVASLLRQLWARRSDFGSSLFWRKAAGIGGSLVQHWAWPDTLFRKSLTVFEERPWDLHIETTNVCNANCVFCAYQYMTRPRKMMAMDVYRTALQQYVELGGGDLSLEVVVGEPCLDPTFLEKIRLARAQAAICNIRTITNGIAIDRIGADALVASGLNKLFISTAGFDEASYTEIYRVKSYQKMRDNVFALLSANQRRNTPLEITIGFRTNRRLESVQSDPDFAEMMKFKPKTDFAYSFDDWSGRIDFTTLPKGFLRREPPPFEEPCIWLYNGPVVFPNGDVGLCGCRDVDAKSELIVGNIAENHLGEIWRSPAVARLRERFKRGDYPDICRSCTMYRNLDQLRSMEGWRRTRLTKKRARGLSVSSGSGRAPSSEKAVGRTSHVPSCTRPR